MIITYELSEESINQAIKQLEQYKKDIHNKTELLRQKVAEMLAEEIQQGFNGAIVDDIIGSPKQADVRVSIDNKGDITLVIADGEDAVWVEFGAGVYYNGTAGSSPHPKGAEMGFTIGDFGKGNGKKRTWGYYDEEGNLNITHGTPALMPMSRAMIAVCNHIQEIAKEVFT